MSKSKKVVKKKKKVPKTHWNYRVLAFPDGDGVYLMMSEVHYTNGKPRAYGDGGARLAGSSMQSLWGSLEKMSEVLMAADLDSNHTLYEPILWGDDRFPKVYKPKT